MKDNIPNNFGRVILKIDRFINYENQKKCHIAGGLIGILVFSIFFCLIFSEVIVLPAKIAFLLLISPFPIAFFFVKSNFYSWVSTRRIEMLLNKRDLANCECDLQKLPPFPNKGWMLARFKEFYTCILYKIIGGFLLGCCLSSTILLIVTYLIRKQSVKQFVNF